MAGAEVTTEAPGCLLKCGSVDGPGDVNELPPSPGLVARRVERSQF